MHTIHLITGFAFGVLFCVAVNSFLYLRRNPTLPPRDGFIVVTRKDGSQHYRRLSHGQPDATTAV